LLGLVSGGYHLVYFEACCVDFVVVDLMFCLGILLFGWRLYLCLFTFGLSFCIYVCWRLTCLFVGLGLFVLLVVLVDLRLGLWF